MDLTRQAEAAEPIADFLHEEEIEPRQIGEYKVEAHRAFVRRWATDKGLDFARVAGPGRVHHRASGAGRSLRVSSA